jgi:hypothetical protein
VAQKKQGVRERENESRQWWTLQQQRATELAMDRGGDISAQGAQVEKERRRD